MLSLTPKPLSPLESQALRDWLDDKSRVVLERVIRNEIAHQYVLASNKELEKPLTMIAKPEQGPEARIGMINAARLKIFLDVLRELPVDFDLYDFTAE